jgi:hypothetical protein
MKAGPFVFLFYGVGPWLPGFLFKDLREFLASIQSHGSAGDAEKSYHPNSTRKAQSFILLVFSTSCTVFFLLE